jgi:hypothetical protein
MIGAKYSFYISGTFKISLIFIFCGIFIVPNYKNKLISNNRIKTLILILSLFISIGTIIIGILVLKESFEFNYIDNFSGIVIGLSCLIPMIFIVVNGLIINGIVKELRK